MIVLLMLACDGGLGTDGGVLGPDIVPAALTVDVAPAWDPLLESTLAVRFSADAAGSLALWVSDDQGAVVVSQTVEVGADGLVDWSWEGEAPVPGAYALSGAFTRDDGEAAELVVELDVVRVGFDAAWGDDDGGVTSERIALTWHQVDVSQEAGTAFTELNALDLDGVALDFPDVSDVLGRPMAGAGQPLAYRYDSLPLITVTLSEAAAVGEQALGLEAEGWTVLTEGPLAPGQAVTLQRNDPLASGLALVEETVRLGFTATDGDGDVHDLGAQFLPLRFYALIDSPTSTGGEVWPAAIEPLLQAIGGSSGDPEAVLDVLVSWVFNDLGLAYDTSWGASYYTAYFSEDWEQGHFYFSDFLERRFGSIVNCSDCASILVAYANMIGVPLNYRIIGWNFQLNQILAIGGDEYTNCPFGRGGCGFSYHAVTGGLDYDRIWDATLALDGDSNPTELPADTLLVQSIDEDEYLDRLVKSGHASYEHEAQGTMQ